MLRIGVLNVFWFGLKPADDTLDVGFYHEPDDDLRVAGLIAAASLDAIVLVEIVDIARAERLIKGLSGNWRLRDDTGAAICSRDPSDVSDNIQRVVLAWNDDVIELLRWDRPIHAGPRVPVVARLRHRTDMLEITVVGVHPKSGILRGWDSYPADSKPHQDGQSRVSYFRNLAAWLSAPPAEFQGRAVVLGDFNSVYDSPEVEPLRMLPGWQWPASIFVPEDADLRTTRTDPEIIDHIVLSPELTFSEYTVLAFDLLPEFQEPIPSSELVWKRTTDHRPVRISIKESA
jgi:hypothetical protein